MTEAELKAFVALLYSNPVLYTCRHQGVKKASTGTACHLKKWGFCFFPKEMMVRNHSRELTRFPPFDNKKARGCRKTSLHRCWLWTNLSWEKMKKKHRSSQTSRANITMDEQLFPHRGPVQIYSVLGGISLINSASNFGWLWMSRSVRAFFYFKKQETQRVAQETVCC